MIDNKWLTVLTIVLLSTIALPQTLPFHRAERIENIDVHSFAGTMLLKHDVPGTFRKLPKNPIFQPGGMGWDSEDVSDPFILQSGDSLMLFYSGSSRSDEQYHIGYAVRDETGWFWKKRDKIISGSGGAWDTFHQLSPIVLREPDRWLMIYSGNDEDSELGYETGVATSADGKSWQYYVKNPVLPSQPGFWDASGQIYGDIVFLPETGEYRLYYTGFQGPFSSIGLATSSDGINWKHSGDQPVFSRLPGVIAPDVIYNGETWQMFFVQAVIGEKGVGTKICRVTSPDGIKWSEPEDILQPTDRWEKGNLLRPQLVYMEGRMSLYFCGGSGRWQIGAATTVPVFRGSGSWLSNAIPKNAIFFELVYEQPYGTEISVFLQSGSRATPQPLPIENALPTGRSQVFRAKIPLPETGASNRKIELRFSTTDPSKSPVVYEMRVR